MGGLLSLDRVNDGCDFHKIWPRSGDNSKSRHDTGLFSFKNKHSILVQRIN